MITSPLLCHVMHGTVCAMGDILKQLGCASYVAQLIDLWID